MGNVKRGLKMDIRTRQCADCGAIYTAMESLYDITIDGGQQLIASLDIRTVKSMQESYMSKKTRALRNQLQLFGETNAKTS